jgi:Tol biopolymer transport system component
MTAIQNVEAIQLSKAMWAKWAILFIVVLCVGCASENMAGQMSAAETHASALDLGAVPDAACEIADITRAPDGLVVWSPTGEQYIVNRKDAAGIYQLYVGTKGSSDVTCITCTQRLNSPAVDRHKLQPHWHPSGKWIVLAGERENYDRPLISTPKLIEGWIQSGLWVNIYITRPDGSEWHQLSDFGHQRGDGFTGVAFTPDGTKAVWAQIVDGNIFAHRFGRWELILADFPEDPSEVPSFTNFRNITPAGANWVEPGNFAPDGRLLLITADIGLSDAQGMDQFILDITTGSVRNLTNSPNLWDEHGVFSPDGEKILFMSSYPFRDSPFRHNVLFLKTEFMLMNKDGSSLRQLTHFNSSGYPESNTLGRGSVAANGEWAPDGRSVSVLNLFFPTYETWTINFKGSCGGDARFRSRELRTFRSKEVTH